MRETLKFGLALVCCSSLFSADLVPPLPSDFPAEVKSAPEHSAPATPSVVLPQRQFPSPRLPAAPKRILPTTVRAQTANAAAAAAAATPTSTVDQVLAWDAVLKEYTAQPGDMEANFTFTVTNIATTNVVINWVRPSCGCTVAKLPPTPWTLTPGEVGNIDLTLDLKGKHGTLYKYVNVDTSNGAKMLNIRVTVPEGITVAGMESRLRNMQLAMADRQIVFRGDCAKCHSAPLAGKTGGEEIYQAGCAICHDTPNRATMVPDLNTIANPGNKEFWQVWIRHGKPGTLMPAFAQSQGGPMTESQIVSLSEFLTEKFPARAAATNAAPAGLSPAKPTALLKN